MLSKNTTRKSNLSIRYLQQTLLGCYVFYFELFSFLRTTIDHLGSVLSPGNGTSGVSTVLLVAHEVPEVDALEGKLYGTLLADILDAIGERLTRA